MASSSDSVLEAALALDKSDRAHIAEKLLESLGDTGQDEIDAAWAAEAELRLQAYREGKIESFSADEVFAASITATSRSEIDEAWAAEAERRDRAVNDGSEELLDGDEILAKLSRGECP